MPDRIPSDHPTVESFDATLDSRGATDRLRVVLPDDVRDVLDVDEVLRLVVDGDECRSRVEESLGGDLELRGAYHDPAAARDPTADDPNLLVEWIEHVGLDIGRTVHFDVVSDGLKYGLRAPGERVVYEATEPPSGSLATIAERVDGED